MVFDIIWLIVGLVLIIWGADRLVGGASWLALRLGMSDLVVGLTVVALGTSTPELAISVISASQGATQLAVGNVVGSNIANILLIIGVVALVKPITVTDTVMTRQMPLMVLSSLLLLLFGNTALLDGAPANVIYRTDGIMLLFLTVLFVIYTVKSARGQVGCDTPEPESAVTVDKSTKAAIRATIFIVVGLAALVFGGDKFVDGASGLARRLGLSEAVIGLTIVAVGTSLPELATSVVAAVKGSPGLAVGNVIGSNILNVSLVLGASATVRPLQFGDIGNFDLLTLLGASLAFWLMGWLWGHRVIKRAEGAILLIAYIAYLTYLIL